MRAFLRFAERVRPGVRELPHRRRIVRWDQQAGELPHLPATDDNVGANDALSIRAEVSPTTIRMIEASGHSYEEGARRYIDLVGLHALGMPTRARSASIRRTCG